MIWQARCLVESAALEHCSASRPRASSSGVTILSRRSFGHLEPRASCSLTHLLTCFLTHLLTYSLAHLLTCSLVHLITC